MALSGNEKFDVEKGCSVSGSSPYSKMTKKELSEKFMVNRLKVSIRRGYRGGARGVVIFEKTGLIWAFVFLK